MAETLVDVIPPVGPRTPKRAKPFPVDIERHSERRKSLFNNEKSDSELSNISPLSNSSGVSSPDRVGNSAWTPTKTPRKGVDALENNFTQLLLDKTPPKSPRELRETPKSCRLRKSPRIRGVSPLKPDRGVISPMTFYGRKSPATLDGAEMVRRIRLSSTARLRLFLDDISKEKKRGRSGSSEKKRPKKKLKTDDVKTTPKVPSPPIVRPAPTSAPTPGKKRKPLRQVCDWENLSFRKADSPTPGGKKYIFFNPNKNEDVLTPPASAKKKKKLLTTGELYLSLPDKTYQGTPEKSKEKSIVEMIKDDFGDSEEEEDVTVKSQVQNLLTELENKEPGHQEICQTPKQEICQAPQQSLVSSPRFYPVFEINTDKKPAQRSLVFSASKLKPTDRDSRQLQLDFGQSTLREIECPTCGLVYCSGDAQDEYRHNEFHTQTPELRFPGWKEERVAGIGLDFKVVQIVPGDPAPWWSKFEQLSRLVDSDLGSTPVTGSHQGFVYVKKRMVAGICIAVPLSKAYKMLSTEEEIDLVSKEEYPVKCGVARLWVHPSHRRSGIATQLVNAVRRNFMYGAILRIDDLAFSVPTIDGKQFASKYTQRSDYFVYM